MADVPANGATRHVGSIIRIVLIEGCTSARQPWNADRESGGSLHIKDADETQHRRLQPPTPYGWNGALSELEDCGVGASITEILAQDGSLGAQRGESYSGKTEGRLWVDCG